MSIWNRILLSFALFGMSSLPAAAEGKKPGVVAHIELNPVGSFDAESNHLIGSGVKSGKKFTAKELKIPVASLSTGMSLRDNHLKKKLQVKKYPNIIVSDVQAENGKGTAKIKIMDNPPKPIELTYKVVGKDLAEAEFEVNLADFKISGINYKGVGVEDIVKITAIVPFK